MSRRAASMPPATNAGADSGPAGVHVNTVAAAADQSPRTADRIGVLPDRMTGDASAFRLLE
jgi:hypothetical protein